MTSKFTIFLFRPKIYELFLRIRHLFWFPPEISGLLTHIRSHYQQLCNT